MLSDKKIKALKPKEKRYEIHDRDGLYMRVTPSGKKTWYARLSVAGKRKRHDLGTYPEMSLADARNELCQVKKRLSQGDLVEELGDNAVPTVADITHDWLELKKNVWTERSYNNIKRRLERYWLPEKGHLLPDEVKPLHILKILEGMQAQGYIDSSHRLKTHIQKIYSLAIIKEKATINPGYGFDEALQPNRQKHNPHLTAKELPEFFEAYREIKPTRDPIVTTAFEIMLYSMVRTKEARFCSWPDLDYNDDLWRVYPDTMKKRTPHLVPITPPLKECFEFLLKINGDYQYPLTASYHDETKPISENAVLYLIYDMGYKGRLTGHGLRGTASTILGETGKFRDKAIKLQLSHMKRGTMKPYDHTELMQERREMMLWWSEYVHSLINA